MDQALARPAHQWLRIRGVGDGQLPIEKQRCQAMHLGPRGGRELVGLTAREFTRGLAPLDAVLQFDERAQRRCLHIRKRGRVDAVAEHDAKVVGMFERETNVCPTSVDELLHRIRVAGRRVFQRRRKDREAIFGDGREQRVQAVEVTVRRGVADAQAARQVAQAQRRRALL